MRKAFFLLPTVFIICFPCLTFANTSPQVSNVTASQRTDGSGVVDIGYTLADADNDGCTISVQVSADGGSTWSVSATDLSGDIGAGISLGRRHIIWNSKTDLPGEYGANYRVKVIADDGFVDGPSGMVWVSINDPGVSGHEGFNGQMSKYETTNAQYCQYLNAAKTAGQITVYYNIVYATSDTSHSQPYFDTYAASSYSQITYSGGTFSVRTRDSYSMANHPVVEVNWYGAIAFCNYYGYRLPTEWEWQAVADYDGSYTYGCGTTINQSKANYYNYSSGSSNPLGLSSKPYTSPVDHYSSYGYGMNDMAGNVWEWTSSLWDPGYSYRVIRGGSWNNSVGHCEVSCRGNDYPYGAAYGGFGFRACR